MKVAFTMDDLPLWPMSWPPKGYTPEGIVADIRAAPHQHAITGVYSFSNGWPLTQNPELAGILDDWVGDGHHIANHTQSHIQLPDVRADVFIADIAEAQRALAPWMSQAPRRMFRHPLCHWGETGQKLAAVNGYLGEAGLTPVDVTPWCYEWTWDRAWRNVRHSGDKGAQALVRSSFVAFSVAQLNHDAAAARAWFGQDCIAIALGHNVPFFAEIAEQYLGALIGAGAEFVPLELALTGPVQVAVGSVVSDRFLVLQQKPANAAGTPTAQFAPGFEDLCREIVAIGQGQTG